MPAETAAAINRDGLYHQRFTQTAHGGHASHQRIIEAARQRRSMTIIASDAPLAARRANTMRRSLAILLTLACCVGCASKSPPTAASPPQPSLAQRLFGSLPHPTKDDSYRPIDNDKRDKDNDF
jgi:hypothetical protein